MIRVQTAKFLYTGLIVWSL